MDCAIVDLCFFNMFHWEEDKKGKREFNFSPQPLTYPFPLTIMESTTICPFSFAYGQIRSVLFMIWTKILNIFK